MNSPDDRPERKMSEILPDSLNNKEILGIAQQGLQENQVDLYLQPVDVLPQRKTRFYEALSRIRNEEGSVIAPEKYLAIAAQMELLTKIRQPTSIPLCSTNPADAE